MPWLHARLFRQSVSLIGLELSPKGGKDAMCTNRNKITSRCAASSDNDPKAQITHCIWHIHLSLYYWPCKECKAAYCLFSFRKGEVICIHWWMSKRARGSSLTWVDSPRQVYHQPNASDTSPANPSNRRLPPDSPQSRWNRLLHTAGRDPDSPPCHSCDRRCNPSQRASREYHPRSNPFSSSKAEHMAESFLLERSCTLSSPLPHALGGIPHPPSLQCQSDGYARRSCQRLLHST